MENTSLKTHIFEYAGDGSKTSILEFIKSTRRYLVHRLEYKILSDCDKLLKTINDSGLSKHIPSTVLADFDLIKLEEFLVGPIICSGCGSIIKKSTIFSQFCKTRKGVCGKYCDLLHKSKRMSGAGNTYHKLSKETKENLHRKQALKIKKLIECGKFTPEVTNSWAKSRCLVRINGIVKKVRSSWEAYFYIANPTLHYEKLRVPYFNRGVAYTYIVDFIDYKNRIVYEIKPEKLKQGHINLVKEQALLNWCKSNNYEYVSIDESWFTENYDESILVNQPDQQKLTRLLKQFNTF